MAKSTKSKLLTIIDNKNLRGILASPKILSKELLEDIVDLIEWSNPKIIQEDEELIAKADKENSWITGDEIEKRLKMRLKKSRK